MIDRKTALVTGGGRGIGRAVAVKLAGRGYALAVAGTSPREKVREALEEIAAAGGESLYVRADIGTAEGRRELVRQVMETYGRIDVLVNNAGVAPRVRRDILETTEESLDYVLGVNLKGTFFLTQAVANIMVEEIRTVPGIRPKIVNISSVSAYATSVQRGEYCISKAGISMITQLFADRLAEYGIAVNEARPGVIRTDMTAKVQAKYDRLIEEGIFPIRRWGTPGDVAGAVAVLCSDELPYSTGEVLNVDGGFHIRRL